MPDDNSEREPPDSIPNSEVKAFSADGSVGLPHVRVGHCQASKLKGLILRGKPFFTFIRRATEILWNSRLEDSMTLYPATVYQPRRRPQEMPKYLSARAQVRTRRPKFPVYCIRHHAVDTASRWFQEHFLCHQNRPHMCFTSGHRQLLWTMFCTMEIVSSSNFQRH